MATICLMAVRHLTRRKCLHKNSPKVHQMLRRGASSSMACTHRKPFFLCNQLSSFILGECKLVAAGNSSASTNILLKSLDKCTGQGSARSGRIWLVPCFRLQDEFSETAVCNSVSQGCSCCQGSWYTCAQHSHPRQKRLNLGWPVERH